MADNASALLIKLVISILVPIAVGRAARDASPCFNSSTSQLNLSVFCHFDE
jgi:hypothetical protein